MSGDLPVDREPVDAAALRLAVEALAADLEARGYHVLVEPGLAIYEGNGRADGVRLSVANPHLMTATGPPVMRQVVVAATLGAVRERFGQLPTAREAAARYLITMGMAGGMAAQPADGGAAGKG